MVEGVLAALVGATAVLAIALAGWLAPRITKKGRLLNELRLLGGAYSDLPEGPQKELFAEHIHSVVTVLNRWLDPINRRKRVLQAIVSWAIYAVAVG